LEDIDKDLDKISRIDAVTTILEVICRTTGMGFAAVARVTEDKWIACAVNDNIQFGLTPGGELEIETTICNEIRHHRQPVVIDDVTHDQLYCNHHTPATYGFRSYISTPITLKNGDFFGTLCAIDPKPIQLNNAETIGMFTLFADLISFHIDALNKLDASASKLLEEQKTSELRDQFIAILGHDLRNPVGAVLNVAQILLRMPTDDRVKHLANILQDSSYRMKALIDNILDFARGRLGDGITIERSTSQPLEPLLQQVVNELQLIWPDKPIHLKVDLSHSVNADGKRIAQMLSNLLSNALTYGNKNEQVDVDVATTSTEFVLTVTNTGKQIPDDIKARLFQPFSRGEVTPNQEGLGLGLYISAEIARAHGGSIDVLSDKHLTTFTFRMPIG
jgi:signal transduction histidine kinase